jgi:Carboxypeptidase regulatory-like domain
MKLLTTAILAILLISIGTGVFYGVRKRRDARAGLIRPAQLPAKSDFRIEGRVINAAGEVVPGAQVFAELDDAGSTLVPTDVSDSSGRFSIMLNQTGRYTVYGSKEEDGYALTISGFHQQVNLNEIPKLVITEPKVVSGIVLQLGQPAARLEGSIKDIGTGKPVNKATITLRRADNPELVYQTSTDENRLGKFRVVVPTAPFTFQLDSPGYESWMYGGEGNQKVASIRLKQGESKNLQVTLHKKKQD